MVTKFKYIFTRIVLAIYVVIHLTDACNVYTENKRLDGLNFRDLPGSRLYSCAAECVSYPICTSFNFLKPSRTCQLNIGDHTTSQERFQDDVGSWYSQRELWNNVSPCALSHCTVSEQCSVQRNGTVVCKNFLQNVSVGKLASASSIWRAVNPPSVLVDGIKERHWVVGMSCFAVHETDQNPWWQVDLNQTHVIIEIVITTRSDCCPERLHDFSVIVLRADPAGDPDVNGTLCYKFEGTVTKAEIKVTCDFPVFGRFVRIIGRNKLDYGDILQMCEVEVYGI